nr:UbiA family prenyltransferase [Natronosporangium hydrolyticum]
MLTSGVIVALARATHPEPTAAVTAVAGLLAFAVGHRPATAALVVATVAASQLAVGWTNDALDAERDAAVGRTDKPIVAGQVRRRTVAVAAAGAGVATVLLALATGPAAAVVAVTGLLSALAYDWPLKATVFSPLPYAVSFAALPAFVVLAASATPPGWLLAAGALLGAGAHFANALPDLADDAATGVYGAPHRLGATGSGIAASGLLLAAAGVLGFGPAGPPAWWAMAGLATAVAAVCAGWWSATRARQRGHRPTGLFRAFLVVALVNVLLLLLNQPG